MALNAMKLDLMYYHQNKDLPRDWCLEGCQLGNINLIVGKNASGKSKILKSIKIIAGLLSGEINLKTGRNLSEWTLFFDSDHDQDKKVYFLKVNRGQVLEERFTVGEKNYLDRNETGEGKVWAEKLNQYIDFQTPIDEVAAVKRRDSIQHPFFEEIYHWANSLRYYEFGTDLGRNSLMMVNEKNIDVIKKNTDFKKGNQVIGIFKLGEEELGESFIDAIKADMVQIGYEISDIGTKTPSPFLVDEGDEILLQGQPQYLYVQEHNLIDETEQVFMSQGMFRALSLIIQINYSLLAGKPSCILIDDIGEGLDFERSSAMIQVLISKAQAGLVQLIMTTNDRFIMNGVPLEYWSVIERKPGFAKLHNIHNSKAVFEQFQFTGLNNFDFFSTQFYIEGFGEEEYVSL